MADIKLPGDIAHIERLALELEGCVARDDLERRDLRQVGRDVLADAVAEIFLLGLAAHVGERKHTYGDWTLARTGRLQLCLRYPRQRDDTGFQLLPANCIRV